MKKVYQTIVDKGHGNCEQAAVASLFGLNLEEVPNFIELGSGYHQGIIDFYFSRGYSFEIELCYWNEGDFADLTNYNGVDGLFVASVASPKYFDPKEVVPSCHAVIINKNFEIVHDPNPEYANIKVYPEAERGYNGIRAIDVYEKIK